MTDLVARVLLKADGSGLVGQVRDSKAALTDLGTSAKATGAAMAGVAGPATQAAAAIAAVDDAARRADSAVDAVAAGMKPAAAAATVLNGAMVGAAGASVQLAVAHAGLETATEALAIAQARAATAAGADATAQARAAAEIVTAQGQIATAQAGVDKAQRESNRAANDNAAAANRQAFGLRNLGQQFGDLGLSIAGGIDPARAFGQQAGQMGYALSEMGGKAGKVGAFLVSPWGIALTVAAAVLAPFASKLFETGKAAEEMQDRLEKAATAADSFGNAQTLLGKIIDLTTGKFKTQNEILRESIRLQATAGLQKARADEKAAVKGVDALGRPSVRERFATAASGLGSADGLDGGADQMAATAREVAGKLAPLTDVTARFRDGAIGIADARREIEKLGASGQLAGRSVNDIVLSFVKLGTARNDQKAAQQALDAIDGKGLAASLKPYEAPKKTRKPKDTTRARQALEEYGEDTADRIAGLTRQFVDAPAQIEKVNRALAQLADIEDDIRRKKPLNMAQLLADAGKARVAIEQGISQPFDDFMRQQAEAAQVQQLVTAGRVDEAAALKLVLGLERQMGPLSQERKDAVLGTVEAMRLEQREADILRDKTQKYLGAIGDVRAAVRGVIFDGVDGVKDLPKRLIAAFSTLKGEQLFDRLFDGAFRDLEDQANGTNVVQAASKRMEGALDLTADPLKRFTRAVGSAADAAAGRGVAGGTTTTSGVSDTITKAGPLVDAAGRVASGEEDITVTASPRRLREDPQAFFANALGRLAKGVGISDDAAKKIGSFGGKAIEGAATGAFANSIFAPLAKGLGIKTSATGAQLGGAIGASTGLPFGAEAGALLGSITGGLLKKTKQGSVTLTSAFGDTDATGNDAGSRKAASGLAGSVQDGLQSIADQLGGTLGGFSVTLGQRHGDYRVTTGSSLKTKNGAVDFNDDADAAAAYALQLAISQGAVKGLSSAVQKAITSSTDVNRALSEALAVQNLEATLGGVAGELGQTFRAIEKEAQERLRLARTFGLDIVATEKLNAQKRAKAFEDVLASRIGALTALASDLAYGDLSEGSAADRRVKLSDETAKALKDAEDGVDGAAEKYAALVRELLSSTKTTFGTAGDEYASDRTTAEANIARLVQLETDRVRAAATDSAPVVTAVEKGNALSDEIVDQNAQLLAKMDQLIALTGGGGVIFTPDYAATARVPA